MSQEKLKIYTPYKRFFYAFIDMLHYINLYLIISSHIYIDILVTFS